MNIFYAFSQVLQPNLWRYKAGIQFWLNPVNSLHAQHPNVLTVFANIEVFSLVEH